MKLEYRIIEVAEGDRQHCNYCLLDFRSKISFGFTAATHQIAAFKEDGEYADIAYICGECKKELENDSIPRCEICGRVKRNREACFCKVLKDRSAQPLSSEEIISRTFSSRLEKKTKELENELSTKGEEITTHLEALKVSEVWNKIQKQELLDRIKKLEEENKQLKEQLTSQQVAQIEVKEAKKLLWKLRK